MNTLKPLSAHAGNRCTADQPDRFTLLNRSISQCKTQLRELLARKKRLLAQVDQQFINRSDNPFFMSGLASMVNRPAALPIAPLAFQFSDPDQREEVATDGAPMLTDGIGGNRCSSVADSFDPLIEHDSNGQA